MMLAIVIITLYSLMIAVFGKEVGLLFATIFLLTLISFQKISEVTGLDKLLDKWLERE